MDPGPYAGAAAGSVVPNSLLPSPCPCAGAAAAPPPRHRQLAVRAAAPRRAVVPSCARAGTL